MQTVILAAGMGRRLGALTTALPKALIEVAGRTLIDYALAFARGAGAKQRIVVGGFCWPALRAHVAQLASDAVLVENADYQRGNLLSLQTALPLLGGGDLLLMNTDHIYPASVAQLVAAVAERAPEVTAFCDFDRVLGPDDMKVVLDDGRHVRAMSKQLERWDAGYVGMTFVPAASRGAYAEAVSVTAAQDGPAANVERVLAALTPGSVGIADISGHGWFEVDEPAERTRAEQALARSGRSAVC